MKRWIVIFLLISASSKVFSYNLSNHVVGPILPLSSSISISPGNIGFFTPVADPLSLSEEGRRLVDKAVFWSWMSIGGFGASTLGLIVTHAVDETVGGMLSLISVGFWTASNLTNAFAHRDISNEIELTNPEMERPFTAGVASLVGGVLGIGALTAISLSFSDTTGAAEIAAYIGYGLSALAGGYGIYKTFEYAAASGIDLNFF